MSLIFCPDCHREVSTHAPVCIHCGCPITIVIETHLVWRATSDVPKLVTHNDGAPSPEDSSPQVPIKSLGQAPDSSPQVNAAPKAKNPLEDESIEASASRSTVGLLLFLAWCLLSLTGTFSRVFDCSWKVVADMVTAAVAVYIMTRIFYRPLVIAIHSLATWLLRRFLIGWMIKLTAFVVAGSFFQYLVIMAALIISGLTLANRARYINYLPQGAVQVTINYGDVTFKNFMAPARLLDEITSGISITALPTDEQIIQTQKDIEEYEALRKTLPGSSADYKMATHGVRFIRTLEAGELNHAERELRAQIEVFQTEQKNNYERKLRSMIEKNRSERQEKNNQAP